MAVPAWTVLFVAALALRSALAVGVIADSERSSRIQGDGLAVGETVRLKLTTHGGPDVRFLLCGRSNCGVTKIRGIAEDGRLSYRTYAGTNLHGNGGRRTADVDVGKGVPIPDGDYTFVVRRDSAREMSVWQEGRQGQRIVIPIDPEYANLHSKSLTDNVIPPTGGRLQGDRLSVGGSARVRVTAEGDAFARFMLCDDKQCSLVDVLGITPDKRISYWTQTEADAEGYRGRFGAGGDLFVPFPSGAHEFVVERRSEKEASVWLASRPDRVATVAVRPGGDRLFVKDPWRGTVRVQFLSGDGGDPAGSSLSTTARVQGDALSVGETLRVRVRTHGSPDVRFLLCGSANCGVIVVRGVTADGRMSYGAWTDADLFGNGGQLSADVWVGNGTPDGAQLFVVRRVSARELSVWPDGRPDGAASVRVSPEFKSLIVRRRWSGTVQAEFIGATASRLQGDRLGVGDSARVRVTAEGDAFARFMLCDDKQCSLVDVLGITPDKRISYWTQTEADAEGYRGRFGPGGDLFVPFPSGAHEFVAERRSERELAVWLAARPERVATVPVRPGQDRLFVKDPWRESVLVEFLNACGKARAGPAQLVLSGDPTAIESVPWHAALYAERGGQLDYVCGGSLVAPCAVVTAAHCIPSEGNMFVALGKTLSAWDSEEEKGVHKSKVKRTIRHPYYKGFSTKLVYDIAILELEKCAQLHDRVFPVCIDSSVRPSSAAPIKVAGWGNESTVLTELESVRLSQMDFDECFKAMEDNSLQVGFITHDKFCARRPEDLRQVGLLQGDSGGGALVKRDGSWYLAGVVSVRLQGADKDDIFALTDVSQYADWVSKLAKW